jgi:hypothetical protein
MSPRVRAFAFAVSFAAFLAAPVAQAAGAKPRVAVLEFVDKSTHAAGTRGPGFV